MLTANIGFPSNRAFSGQELGFFAKFALEPVGISMVRLCPQGTQLPLFRLRTLTSPARVFVMPEADRVRIPVLEEIVPVYRGAFEGLGTLLLRHPLPEGMIFSKVGLIFSNVAIPSVNRRSAFPLRSRLNRTFRGL